jgi:hypothetical protein
MRPADCSIGSTCGRGQREREAEGERGGDREAGAEADHHAEREAAQDDLKQAEAENVALHPPQPRRAEFEADKEQQQGDAEFGDAHLAFGTADQPEHLRADQRAGHEIAERRAQPHAAEDQDEQQSEAE